MFKVKDLMFIIAETPVHAGSGSELGVVDLPIQRECYTGFPKIEASGLKGCLREAFESILGNGRTEIEIIFGPEETAEHHAGAMSITDARILLFPVKSLKGVFAWITCPLVIERFKKELNLIGENSFNFKVEGNTIPENSDVVLEENGEKLVILEEFTFKVKADDTTYKLAEWLSQKIFPQEEAFDYWRERIKKNLVVLSDDEFAQFVKTSTEVITRTKIDNKTGTVAPGALWTEEYLPQDSILYSLVMFTSPRVTDDSKKGKFKANSIEEEAKLVYQTFKTHLPPVIQIGGNQTIGKGFVRIKLLNE